jgi:rRNA pseudouridine-1189 N-methylase Emg1 (Nep1/Mra1 family)
MVITYKVTRLKLGRSDIVHRFLLPVVRSKLEKTNILINSVIIEAYHGDAAR